MSKLKIRTGRKRTAILGAGLAIAIAVSNPLTASAASDVAVSGDVATGEYALYYGTYRYHTAAYSGFKLTSASPGFCASDLGIQLYNSNGSTNWTLWHSTGFLQSFTWSGGYVLPTGSYAFAAHNRGGGYCYYPDDRIYWSGILDW